jgi:F-type H+-transporting ATPase subunit delta
VTVKRRSQEYARAIYELALETWIEQLNLLNDALMQTPSLGQVLCDPAATPATLRERLTEAIGAPLSAQVASFVSLLGKDGQLDQLSQILMDLDRLVRHGPQVRIAEVTSAASLTPAEEASLKDVLTQRFGSDLEFGFSTDPDLLGGIRVRVGDQVIDGSIAGKLESLRDRLAA